MADPAQLAFIPDAPATTTVTGTVTRVTFGPTDDGFAIVRLDVEGKNVTVKGTLGRVSVGESLKVEGVEEQHPKFGAQLKVVRVVPVQPTSVDGVARYLATLPGIGDVLARRMADAYGPKAIDELMDHPEAVARTIKVGEHVTKKAAAAAREKRDEQQVLVDLYAIGLTPAFASRVLKVWGGKAMTIIRMNPYRLARDIPLIGFALADSIARNLGIPPDALERREAAILHVLNRVSESGIDYTRGGRKESTGGGHCYLPRSTLVLATAELLAVAPRAVDEALASLEQDGAIVVEDADVYGKQLHRAETSIAERVGILLRNRREPPPAPKAGTPAAAALEPLTDEQRRAVETVRDAGVVVMTGGPGTGKTTVVKAIVAAWEQAKRRVLLCAPTGRAAKRLSESTGRIATTIHRMLGWDRDRGEFQHNERMPLACDLLVIDEASMLDTPLARSVLAAVPQGGTVLLVGDVDQLPSVGAGQVLHDIIGSGAVPVARLSRIFRQAEGSKISEVAAAVLQGKPPFGGDGQELQVVGIWPPDDETPAGPIAQAEVVRQCCEVLPARGFPPRQIQVLTPMHKGPVGTRELNKALQAAFNATAAELRRGGDRPSLRVGDPVLQTRNNYDLDVMNGDLGRITAVDPAVPSVTSTFDDREVVHEKEAILELELAYAISIHKSQGGEYPAVVVVLLQEHYIMLRRNLLYTAITRGKRQVVIVGQHAALARAARTRDTSTRNTGLKGRLQLLDRAPVLPGLTAVAPTRRAKEVDLSGATPAQVAAATTASQLLAPEQHVEECPVRHGASATCVLPLVACVPLDFELPDDLVDDLPF